MTQRGLRQVQGTGRRGHGTLPVHFPHEFQVDTAPGSLYEQFSWIAASISFLFMIRNRYIEVRSFDEVAHVSAMPESVLPSPDVRLHPRLPAHHDHVGSFLRPDYLLAAREQRRSRRDRRRRRCAQSRTAPSRRSCVSRRAWALKASRTASTAAATSISTSWISSGAWKPRSRKPSSKADGSEGSGAAA